MSTWTYDEGSCRVSCSQSGLIFQMDEDEMAPEYGHVFAEALDVLDSTGKTPTELAASLADAQAEIARLRGALEALDAIGFLIESSCATPNQAAVLRQAREALK